MNHLNVSEYRSARKVSGARAVFSFVALATLTLVSCSRTFDSKTPTDPIPAAPPVPASVHLALIDSGLVVTWAVSDSAAAASFRIYLSDSGPSGDFLLTSSTSGFIDTLTGLINGKTYSVQVASVSLSGFEGERSTISTAVVGLFSMSIQNDEEFTNRTSVSITFFTPAGATAVRMSEDSTFANAAWQGFAGLKNFELSAGDGVKVVYAELQLADGSSLGRSLRDSIILDTRAEITSLSHSPSGATLQAGDTVDFMLDGNEAKGTASVTFGSQTLALFDDGLAPDAVAEDGVYTRRFVIPGGVEVNNQQIIGNFVDGAGNNALSYLDTALISIANPPAPVTVSALTLSQAAIRIEWTPSSASDFSSYRLFRSASPTVTESDELVTTVSTAGSTVFTDDGLSDNQTYYYRIYVYDVTNLSAPSNTVSAKTLINQPPTAVALSGVVDSAGVVSLTWTLNNDDDFASYQVYNGVSASINFASRIATLNSQNVTSYRAPSITSTEYYWVVVVDAQGLTARSDSVQVAP